MASGINIGDDVYVCRSRLAAVNDQTQAFYKSEVLDKRDRSVSVKLPDGTRSEYVSTKFAHKRVGVGLVAFGDFGSEATLLDPLAKTVLQYCRLLFGDDDYVRSFKIRTEAELSKICADGILLPYEHLIVLGHGAKNGTLSGATGEITVDRLIEIFSDKNPDPWIFSFLCCYLGRAAFAKQFSKSAICGSLVAPFNAVHGAVSAQFVQTYLIKHLLEGETTSVAHRHASESTPQGSRFRLWVNGIQKA